MPRLEKQEEHVPLTEIRQCSRLAMLVDRGEGGDEGCSEHLLRLQHTDFNLCVV